MIILIIASFLYIAGAIRKRLKKETIEVEDVLHNNLNNLKKAVDQELIQLNKFKTMSFAEMPSGRFPLKFILTDFGTLNHTLPLLRPATKVGR